tara:strand:+ start:3746 stop:5596 length:1851 start_codon:yes stop_codon:yes gene_type:complete
MAAIDDLRALLEPIAKQRGIALADLDPDALVRELDDDTIEAMLLPILRDEDRARFNKFNDLFPDTGPLRRELYPKHLEFFRVGKEYRERCFMAANRVGKAQPNDEPVLTPHGFAPMGTLRLGDEVIGADGKPTRVAGVFPQGAREIVTVRMSDGSTTRCDLDHLWTARPVSGGRTAPEQTLTARELMARILKGERWMLPQRPSVTYADRPELPADPYLIGVLLGDGGLSTDRVLLSMQDDDFAEQESYLRQQAAAFACDLRRVGDCTWHFATTVKVGGHHHNFLRQVLDGLGMAGKTSHNKRVPAEYMLASEADRLAVLQGLMDTDGSCSKATGARQFYSVNRDLCEDVASLARSLGMNARVLPKNGRYRGELHCSWRVHLAASAHNIFRLERKAKHQRFAGRRMRGVMIEAIEPAGQAECTCIKVEAQDSLYLTRDFIVTHNTVAGAYETTAHLTGKYPHWWEGARFNKRIRAWVAGDTNETTRDIIQLELLGEVTTGKDGRKAFDGSGLIPRECIGQPKWKAGVQDLADTVPIQHTSGQWSSLAFKSFDQGRRSFQGTAKELIWLDEECPLDVYSECLIRTATTRGIVMTTFTPLKGLSENVLQFLPQDMRPGE